MNLQVIPKEKLPIAIKVTTILILKHVKKLRKNFKCEIQFYVDPENVIWKY